MLCAGVEVQNHVRYGKGGILERKRHVVYNLYCFHSTRRFDPNRSFLSCTKQNNWGRPYLVWNVLLTENSIYTTCLLCSRIPPLPCCVQLHATTLATADPTYTPLISLYTACLYSSPHLLTALTQRKWYRCQCKLCSSLKWLLCIDILCWSWRHLCCVCVPLSPPLTPRNQRKQWKVWMQTLQLAQVVAPNWTPTLNGCEAESADTRLLPTLTQPIN